MSSISAAPSRSHNGFNALLEDLNSKWQLGLSTRDDTWFPLKENNTPPENCVEMLKFLYFTSHAELNNLINDFPAHLSNNSERNRLHLFSDFIRPVFNSQRTKVKEQHETKGSMCPTRGGQAQEPPLLHKCLRPMSLRIRPPTFPLNNQLTIMNAEPTVPPTAFDLARLRNSTPQFQTPPESPAISPEQSPRSAACEEQNLPAGRTIQRKRLSDDSFEHPQPRSPKMSRIESEGRQTSSFKPTSSCQPIEFPRQTTHNPSDGMHTSFAFSETTGNSSREQSIDASVCGRSTDTNEKRSTSPSFGNYIMKEDSRRPGLSHKYCSDLPSVDGYVEPYGNIPQADGNSNLSSPSNTSVITDSDPKEREIVAQSCDQTASTVPLTENMHFAHLGPLGISASLAVAFGDQTNTIAGESSKTSIIGNTQQSRSSAPPEHYQVKNFPHEGLFCGDTSMYSQKAMHLSPRVRYELARIALENDLKIEDFMPKDRDYNSYDELLKAIKRQSKVTFKLPGKVSSKAWKASGINGESANVYRKATLSYQKDPAQPIFKLALEPLKVDRSCRFHRGFGGDRFLYITIPDLEFNLTGHLKDQGPHLVGRFREWFGMEHSFLGRTWKALHFQRQKPKRKHVENSQKSSFRVVLFAARGDDIPLDQHRSIEDVINWFIPLENERNRRQSYCKIFARLELGFSKTIPTIVFKPHQIRRRKDIHADGTPEATLFDDPNDRFKPAWAGFHMRRDLSSVSMNDGCSRISYGACLQIYQKLGLTGPMPSAFQGRIGGAKGVWIRSAGTDTSSPDDLDVWIEINDSQLKFEFHDSDLNDTSFDEKRLSLDVNRWSTCPKPSSLHVNFLPILKDRGVKIEDIHNFIAGALSSSSSNFLKAIKDDVGCRRWMHQNFPTTEERLRKEGIMWQAGLPLSNAEKINFLLEHGFSPGECPYLGLLLQEMAESSYTTVVQNLKIKVHKSTSIIGVSDPVGVLQPGNIHIALSKPFVDEDSGDYDMTLHGKDVLVTRHPTLRISDIQKVRVVNHPALSHIVDLVVYPSKGCIPLASKLQGGDYDGDTFVIIWEPTLVKDFMNAPAPRELPKPESFGIEVDRTTLGEILDGHDGIGTFLRKSVQFTMQLDVLGRCTNLHENLAYAENDLGSAAVEYVVNFHDLMIDAPKSGYICNEEIYRDFVNKIPHTNGQQKRHLKTPAYKESMQTGFKGAIDILHRQKEHMPMQFKGKPGHVLDDLLFWVVMPSILDTLKQVSFFFSRREKFRDGQLGLLYGEKLNNAELQIQESTDPIVNATAKRIHKELVVLRTELIKIRELWERRFPGGEPVSGSFKDKGREDFDTRLEDIYALYTSIKPQDVTLPEIASWTVRRLPKEPALWPLIKASAFYELCGVKKPKLVYRMAGKELAYIKVFHCPNPKQITESMWAQLKVGKPRAAGEAEDMYQVSEVSNILLQNDDDSGVESDDEFFFTSNGQTE